MAYSFIQYSANGATTQFAIPFQYISRDHVYVYINGVVDSAKTFVNSAMIQTSTTPANGAVVEVRRITPYLSPVVDFSDASTLTASNLDGATTQFLYLAQEAKDTAATALLLVSDGTFDANGHRIKNVATPSGALDAVNKSYADNVISVASAAAAAAGVAAVSPYATTATTKAAEALASKNAADADVALTHADVVLTHADVVLTHADVVTTGNNVTAAAASVAAAADLLDQFDDRYLGAKASDPTLDNDGNALVTGALYFNTTVGEMRVRTAAPAWVAVSVVLAAPGSSGNILTSNGTSWVSSAPTPVASDLSNKKFIEVYT